MECNRDEAVRAKEIAERKFTAKDIMGAKKFAVKAVKLFPELEGITQMLSTFDVYLAAENKVSGESDWYAILDVSASDDDETVKKQYRKLALILHPDKNKSVGAEGAFKFVSEAWSVLSDKGRRSAYDQKRNVEGQYQKVSQASKDQPASTANGSQNIAKTEAPNTKPPKTTARTAPSTVPTASRPSSTNTFWTACHRCKMQYEYLRVYINHNLLCPHCREPFLAVEIGARANGSSAPASWSFSQHRQQSTNHNQPNKTKLPGRNASGFANMGTTGYPHGTRVDSFNHMNPQWGPYSRTSGVATATASSPASQAPNMVNHAHDNARRKREEAHLRKNYTSRQASTGSFASNSQAVSGINVSDREHAMPTVERLAKKRRGPDDGGGYNYGGNNMEQAATGNGRTGTGIKGSTNFEMDTVNGVSSALLDTRNLLMEKARMEIRKKLDEWSLTDAAKAAKEKEKNVASENVDSSDQSKFDNTINEKKKVLIKNVQASNPDSDLDEEVTIPASINVPDPDFHDFDKDRTERSFEGNQVWAAYDDSDGMPRFYAFIQKIISLRPFRMRFSWLNSKSNSELGPVNWVASGFTKTCGEFRVSRYKVNNTVNIFSHRVRWEKGARGTIRIFPGKGDVWALYRNWSQDWNETTPQEVVHNYEMVEVLDDYNEEQGVSVSPLVKVAGFKTVFHRHMDPAQVKRIPREEMFRFSHQVPSWLLTGEEAENAPRGCQELDPAATPLELLKVITEIKDQVVEIAEQQPVT